MPIQVICPGCHVRFKVNDKFAGKSGPCPKCKTVIKIPTPQEEVVIHAPENYGPKDAQGRAVLKPIERDETRVSPVQIVAIAAVVVLVPLLAFILGRVFSGDVPYVLLGIGAVVLAPPLVWAGYSFLRNDELEPYTGTALIVRVGICALVYAGLWGVYLILKHNLLGDASPEMWHYLFLLPVLAIPGALASLATLDLDGTNATIHFAFYLGVTVLLRVIMGLPAF